MDTTSFNPYFLALLPALVVVWVGIRVYEVREKQKVAEEEYNKFKNTLWPFIHSILSEESGLNVELINHFQTHKNAAREYVQTLRGNKKKEFTRLWVLYEQEYMQIKSLGAFAPMVAIAPSEADLSNITDPGTMEQWEIDRVNRITKLLSELLEVAKVKVWF